MSWLLWLLLASYQSSSGSVICVLRCQPCEAPQGHPALSNPYGPSSHTYIWKLRNRGVKRGFGNDSKLFCCLKGNTSFCCMNIPVSAPRSCIWATVSQTWFLLPERCREKVYRKGFKEGSRAYKFTHHFYWTPLRSTGIFIFPLGAV